VPDQILVVKWKQRMKRAGVAAIMACLGPIAVANNGGPEPLKAAAQAWLEGRTPVAMWRCGRTVVPHQTR